MRNVRVLLAPSSVLLCIKTRRVSQALGSISPFLFAVSVPATRAFDSLSIYPAILDLKVERGP
jgi:hypothetical protein